MSFWEYIKWLIVYRHRTCDTCTGSNGNCDKCDELEKSLYKRDWERWHIKIFNCK